MYYWCIFVLAVLKQGLNMNFDQWKNLANKHHDIGVILQHEVGDFFAKLVYKLQTIIDNVSLITKQTWVKLNKVVVDTGHKVLSVNFNAEISAHANSKYFK